MTASSVSSTGMFVYTLGSKIASAPSFGTSHSPLWPVDSLSVVGKSRTKTDDTVRLLQGRRVEDSASTRQTVTTTPFSLREIPRNTDGVVFVYDFKGDLSIKFMDSFSNLVYQTPPEIFSRLSDMMNNTMALDTTV
ncbi:hypothetical protein [Pelobacter propionicus]|uniref:Uncharacterized protein n=1 Tax=Pelobacter propionicus (strain DSM 2379 / NBRC 103807 / OttBd1) TaxID=338966 RepID=A1AQM7_PELPD|nr:hypothetical protein [Pelobacter propionicus]ABK99647.1 hypothetical protein Ppro_2039 [Pelobacter propionicus DSM 2379]